jgi:hypothetical protein
MEKVLILVFETQISDESIELCAKILHCLKSSVNVLSPVDRHTVTRIASNEGIREAEARERAIHKAYTNLYHIEVLFNKQNVHVTVAAKEMRLPEELLGEIRKTNPGMIVVAGKIEAQVLESLYNTFAGPIFLLPPKD